MERGGQTYSSDERLGVGRAFSGKRTRAVRFRSVVVIVTLLGVDSCL